MVCQQKRGSWQGWWCRGQACSGLLAAKLSWEAGEHALLGFSFWPGGSRLMALEGSHFSPLELPGFDKTRETLLLAGSLGGWLVQVTPQVPIRETQLALLLPSPPPRSSPSLIPEEITLSLLPVSPSPSHCTSSAVNPNPFVHGRRAGSTKASIESLSGCMRRCAARNEHSKQNSPDGFAFTIPVHLALKGGGRTASVVV